ncbi:unnamed protein product, partial [Staurois parvus]
MTPFCKVDSQRHGKFFEVVIICHNFSENENFFYILSP